MRQAGLALLCAAAAVAWAEEAPAPAEQEAASGAPAAEAPAAEERKQKSAPITLKQLTPKETISLDEAVDMPHDI